MQIHSSFSHQPTFGSIIKINGTDGAKKPDGSHFTKDDAVTLRNQTPREIAQTSVAFIMDITKGPDTDVVVRLSGKELEAAKAFCGKNHHRLDNKDTGYWAFCLEKEFNDGVSPSLAPRSFAESLTQLKSQSGKKAYQNFKFPDKPAYAFDQTI